MIPEINTQASQDTHIDATNLFSYFLLDPLAPVTKVQEVGLRVPDVCDTNSTLFSIILARDGGSLYKTPNIIEHELCSAAQSLNLANTGSWKLVLPPK